MILFVKTTDLFLVRHHTGRYLKWNNPDDVPHIRWSENLIKSVCHKFETVVIFNDLVRENEKVLVWPRVSIRIFIKTVLSELSNIDILDYLSDEKELAMQIWKKCVLNYGGMWNTKLSHYDIVFNNIDCYVDCDQIVWVGVNGDQQIGIIPEKRNSFMALAKSREEKSTW